MKTIEHEVEWVGAVICGRRTYGAASRATPEAETVGLDPLGRCAPSA